MSQCNLSRGLELELMNDVYQCLERLLQTVQLKRLENNKCVIELCSFVIENICISVTNDGQLYQISNYFNELGFKMLQTISHILMYFCNKCETKEYIDCVLQLILCYQQVISNLGDDAEKMKEIFSMSSQMVLYSNGDVRVKLLELFRSFGKTVVSRI